MSFTRILALRLFRWRAFRGHNAGGTLIRGSKASPEGFSELLPDALGIYVVVI